MLQIEIENQTSLQEAVQMHLRQKEPVVVDNNSNLCTKCNRLIQPLKQNNIEEYPEVLMLHLMRFKTVYQGSTENAVQHYVQHRVTCEETIHLGGVLYRQVARIYHQGCSLYSGHYFTICRHDCPAGCFWYYNNSIRRLERAEDDINADSRVYVCVYERV